MTPVNAHALARPGSETGFVKQRRPQHVLPISILADISILVKRTQNSMDCAFVQIELIADLSQRQGMHFCKFVLRAHSFPTLFPFAVVYLFARVDFTYLTTSALFPCLA